MSRFLTPLAQSLPSSVPFVGPETQERRLGRPFAARLGANESLFGPSPKALAALAAAASQVWMYGDPENHDLKSAIAAHHGVTPAHVVVGEGIDGLLGYLARLTVTEGTEVVTSLGAYPTFNFHILGFGGALTRVPYRGNHEDPESLLEAAIRQRARLVYLANPDNPMGSHHPGSVIEDLISQLPDDTLLVLDEAYVDLAPPETAARVAPDDPRVIRLRTFSKAHGMAGARVGYALAEPGLARAFDKVRNHFAVGRIVQAGALAALADTHHLNSVRARTLRARAQLGDIARAHGLEPLPSATNFVTLDCGRDGDYARAVLAALTQHGIFVRMPGVAPLDRCIRVSLGDEQAMATFGDALGRALKSI